MTNRLTPCARLGLVCAITTLAACGGGGDAPSPSPAGTSGTAGGSTSVGASTGTSTGTVASPGTRATCNLANFQAEMLDLVNQHRVAGATCGDQGSFPAVGALTWNDALTQASLVHSDDMAGANFFSHTGSDGSSAGQRISAAGYDWQTWGENIAAGQAGVASVVAAWMNSPGHCANLMNPAFRDIGVACVAGSAGNTYRTYWTQSFGAAR
jgi:uncharacterized protein YkwD